MPPDGRLSDTDINYVREWIALGGPHETEGTEVAGANAKKLRAADLWSVQPIADIRVPKVKDSNWCSGELDRFILAKLEREKISPSPAAPSHHLLRRLHYVLTGLPPTMEETVRWDSRVGKPDTSRRKPQEAAIAEYIDELMSRRQFGERWARHWLDIARYADATGATAPQSYPESWRFREYVIDAFHRDKPFDQFVREQLAGDLLPSSSPEQRVEQVIATGFISLGHVPGEDRDLEKLKLDAIDEQLEVIGRVFMGIQIGCARCHDHKLDPFPTRDYYAMAGIFRSTQAGPERRMGLGQLPDGRLPILTDTERTWLDLNDNIRVHGAAEASAIRDEPIHLRGETGIIGDVVPRGLPTLIAKLGTTILPRSESGRRQLAEWIVNPENPLAARVIANRVWHHVFGQGLVQSTDNFGFTGDRPSHPELLDYLARRFRDHHRWSFKSLIRELLLSSTWRQSGVVRKEAMGTDPGNRLLWRANTRRADAEAIVDGIRFVGGTLDLRPAETSVPGFRLGNQDSSRYMVIPQEVLDKRAVYWPVFRKDVPIMIDLLNLFHFPAATGPRGVRDTAAVPNQSLALMNNQVIIDAARHLAEQLPDQDDERRITALYLKTYARMPSTIEVDRAIGFLNLFERELGQRNSGEPVPSRRVAWNRLCHALLVSNEFLVVP